MYANLYVGMINLLTKASWILCYVHIKDVEGCLVHGDTALWLGNLLYG